MIATSGNKAVDAIGHMNFTGNVIPLIWCRKICFENGKPHLNAILILSDIVYWYRPREIRDENTGALVGYEKKFKADLLQRSYQSIADQFGISKRQAKDALDLLDDMGIIYREFRNVETQGGTLFNVMFIGLNPERLSEITFNSDDEPEEGESCMNTDQRRGSYVSSEEGGTTECMEEVHSNVAPPTMDVGTNTENTTENTTRDYNNPINLSGDRKFFVYGSSGGRTDTSGKDVMDGIDGEDSIRAYREIVSENIDYVHLRASQSNESDRKRVDELYEIICDEVCSTKKFIKIGGEEIPTNVVRSVFLKLTSEHIGYVMECMDKVTGKISNIRSYLITALYRSFQTNESYFSQKVTHGQYEYALNNLDNGGELA